MTAPTSASDLRSALAGVRAVLLDLDGVIVLKGELLRGAGEALAQIEARAIPYRIVTNTSLISRQSLSRWGDRLGAPIPARRIMSALSASAAYTRHRYPGEPLFVMASIDALTEFADQRVLSVEDADAPDARAAAVVVGDAPEAVTFDNLNRAFRLVRNGAELIGMHRNPWWLTPEGPTLDSGAIVTGLEFATERPARILGKPSPDFFREAAAELVEEVRDAGGRRLLRREIAMVGDDIRSDVLAAQRVGLRGVFVLSGKHGLADVETVAGGRGGRVPDGISPTLREVVAALGSATLRATPPRHA
ncbi:MAG: HAD-IIA family hydrolase [Chloroflexota bacterium]|nr:HAD-IIA family hydrolase [Chloroflexota bacterium]